MVGIRYRWGAIRLPDLRLGLGAIRFLHLGTGFGPRGLPDLGLGLDLVCYPASVRTGADTAP